MRLFFAIELPAEVQAALGRLKPKDDNRDYRWSDPALLHVTLAFLGEQPELQLEALQRVGETAARAGRSASLRLGAAGSFGSRGSPRVLWVGLDVDLERLPHFQRRRNAPCPEPDFP